MKKSKKVFLSAAIAAAIMGSVSLPQIQAANTIETANNVSILGDLNVGGHVEANTINATGAISSTQINGTTVNADTVDANTVDANTTKTGSLQVKGDAWC